MPRDDKMVSNVKDLTEPRLWKALDNINKQLEAMHLQITDIARLQERVSAHDKVMERYGLRLDSQESRVRETELWQANKQSDSSSVRESIGNIKDDVHNLLEKSAVTSSVESDLKDTKSKVAKLEERLQAIRDEGNVLKGTKDLGKDVLKWFAGLASAFIIYLIQKG